VAPIAEEGLKQIAALYRIEKQAHGTSAEDRLALRQAKSAPKIETFKAWLGHARAQVSTKSLTGEALKYIAKYWGGLILFLINGRIEMDSNAVERTIWLIALQRKNALFAGHDAGAQSWARAKSDVRLITHRSSDLQSPLLEWLTLKCTSCGLFRVKMGQMGLSKPE
jgi:transposase